MKRAWIEYSDVPVQGPMTYWVHRSEPGLRPVPGRGWPTFFVEIGAVTFQFASLEELDECVETLARRVLPRPSTLAAKRGPGHGHANQHWLSRLPAVAKRWRYREVAVSYLQQARSQFAVLMESRSGAELTLTIHESRDWRMKCQPFT